MLDSILSRVSQKQNTAINSLQKNLEGALPNQFSLQQWWSNAQKAVLSKMEPHFSNISSYLKRQTQVAHDLSNGRLHKKLGKIVKRKQMQHMDQLQADLQKITPFFIHHESTIPIQKKRQEKSVYDVKMAAQECIDHQISINRQVKDPLHDSNFRHRSIKTQKIVSQEIEDDVDDIQNEQKQVFKPAQSDTLHLSIPVRSQKLRIPRYQTQTIQINNLNTIAQSSVKNVQITKQTPLGNGGEKPHVLVVKQSELKAQAAKVKRDAVEQLQRRRKERQEKERQKISQAKKYRVVKFGGIQGEKQRLRRQKAAEQKMKNAMQFVANLAIQRKVITKRASPSEWKQTINNQPRDRPRGQSRFNPRNVSAVYYNASQVKHTLNQRERFISDHKPKEVILPKLKQFQLQKPVAFDIYHVKQKKQQHFQLKGNRK